MSKCWVYHKTKEPMIIDADEAEDYYQNGWADSPAKFVKVTDFGIDPDNEADVQALGESIEGVKDMLNGSLNLEGMDKDELEEYAQKHFGVDLDKRKKPEKLRAQIQALIDGDSERDS